MLLSGLDSARTQTWGLNELPNCFRRTAFAVRSFDLVQRFAEATLHYELWDKQRDSERDHDRSAPDAAAQH